MKSTLLNADKIRIKKSTGIVCLQQNCCFDRQFCRQQLAKFVLDDSTKIELIVMIVLVEEYVRFWLGHMLALC